MIKQTNSNDPDIERISGPYLDDYSPFVLLQVNFSSVMIKFYIAGMNEACHILVPKYVTALIPL